VALDTVSMVVDEPSTDDHRCSSFRYRIPFWLWRNHRATVSTSSPSASSIHTAMYGLRTRCEAAAA
jgi:hypothetical protein